MTTVLRKVCDNVLNEKGVDNKVRRLVSHPRLRLTRRIQTLLNRARALAFLGAIYKQVQPEAEDDERRELERLVAEAGGKSE